MFWGGIVGIRSPKCRYRCSASSLEGNETLRLFATPLHAWERLASSQKLTLLRPFVASEYAVTCYVMTQHQSGLG